MDDAAKFQETIITECGPLILCTVIAIYFLYISSADEKIMGVQEWKPKHVDDEQSVIRFKNRQGDTLVGHLYLPENKQEKYPVVLFCLGMGLTQDAKLHQFVQRIVRECQAAVFTFDYRTFGESEGYPRHQVKPSCQVADIQAALEQMRKHPKVDQDRIALWGSSLGGGHALMVAAAAAVANEMNNAVPPLKAVVSMVPHTASGIESVLKTIVKNPASGLLGLARVALKLVMAIGRALLGRATYLPLHGAPGSAAIMQNPGDDEGYGSLPPPATAGKEQEHHWKNAATVGSVPSVLFYRPLNTIKAIQCPTLLLVAAEDTLCPAGGAKRAAKMIANASLVLLEDATHFDVYDGEAFERVMKETTTFLKKRL